MLLLEERAATSREGVLPPFARSEKLARSYLGGHVNWIAFDFDDTLVASRKLVEEAYRYAGVQPNEFPSGWYGTPGLTWLTPVFGPDAQGIYAKKQRRYAELIKSAPELPPARLARLLSPVALVTAAPAHAISPRLKELNVAWSRVFTNCSYEGKVAALRDIGRGVYVDDLGIGAHVAHEAGWRWVHYWGQSARELAHQLVEVIV